MSVLLALKLESIILFDLFLGCNIYFVYARVFLVTLDGNNWTLRNHFAWKSFPPFLDLLSLTIHGAVRYLLLKEVKIRRVILLPIL